MTIMASAGDIETRAVSAEREKLQKYKILPESSANHSLSRSRTFVGDRLFKGAKQLLEDEKRYGWRSSIDTMSIDAVKDLVNRVTPQHQ